MAYGRAHGTLCIISAIADNNIVLQSVRSRHSCFLIVSSILSGPSCARDISASVGIMPLFPPPLLPPSDQANLGCNARRRDIRTRACRLAIAMTPVELSFARIEITRREGGQTFLVRDFSMRGVSRMRSVAPTRRPVGGLLSLEKKKKKKKRGRLESKRQSRERMRKRRLSRKHMNHMLSLLHVSRAVMSLILLRSNR